ncbi:MAG TPA: orotidine 5'-phosphate decarboxylase / HUMPS family protein [Solirubrobacterales bacterium]|nr:orotidine 5'-phosphate decarboxylase / HUMPS family protein [Solirubrobacterales bacterium]
MALDVTDVEVAIRIAESTIDFVDRLEVGTPLINSEGMPRAISALRARFPEMPLIADPKIMDRGWQITRVCVDAGASGVIVEGGAPFETLEAVCEAATESGTETYVDSLGVEGLTELTARIGELPFDYMIMHRGKDEQAVGGRPPIEEVRAAAAERALPAIAVAGGIRPDNVAECVQAPNVEVVIVGEAIISSPSPRNVAAEIRRICDGRRTPV